MRSSPGKPKPDDPWHRTTIFLRKSEKAWLEAHGGVTAAIRALISLARGIESGALPPAAPEPPDDDLVV